MSQNNFLRTYSQRSGADVGRSRTCRWIDGDRPYGDAPFCDAPSAPGVSYCADHAKRCFRAAPAPTGGVFKFK